MEPFLDKLAKNLFQQYGEDISRLCIVFPNRRAGLFLKQYLSKLITRPLWLPEIYALEDFVVMKSGLKVPDQLSLLVKLYQVHQSIEKEKAKPFAEFISWGTMLLADFDEIDQYLADGVEVFSYLDEIKAMKHWNPDGTPLTPFEQDYLRFYNSLAPIYDQFSQKLIAEGQGYFGLAFKQLIANLDNEPFAEWQKVVFAGFNALTTAEEKLFTSLLESGKGEIFWDADDYYLSDTKQEAGRFLRNYLKDRKFGTMNWIGLSLLTYEKQISIIGVPGNVGQAKLAGQLTADMVSLAGNASDVALVLVDESLMLPVLNSIPSHLKDFNVTMGYPLKQTPVFSLLDAIFKLLINARRYARKTVSADGKETFLLRFHHKDIIRLLNHPYLGFEPEAGYSLENGKKARLDKSYYNAGEFSRILMKSLPGLSEVFTVVLELESYNSRVIAEFMPGIITFFRDRFVSSDESNTNNGIHKIDIEYLYHFALLLEKIRLLTVEYDLVKDVETLYELFTSQVSGLRLPFYGEPLKGLQLMGMLETRALDFSHIILLSVNEGQLPKGKHQNTFVPDEVRQEFGLQRYSERNAVFGYHFYRLLQRATNVHILYNTEGNELGGGEMSRFVTQIKYELPGYNDKIHITEKLLSIPAMRQTDMPVIITKNGGVLERLNEIAVKGFSPTTLGRYLACSLQFCYAQVLNISETDLVDETIDAATLGVMVHEVLYETYKPFLEGKVSKKEIETMLPDAVSRVKLVFAKNYSEQELESGKNLLIVKVAENMVKRFLLAETAFIDNRPQGQQYIDILQLESDLEASIDVPDYATGELFKVKLRGKADRIDRVSGTIRVIDYKTGQVKSSEVKVDEIDFLLEHESPAKLLQLLTYAWMFRQMNPGGIHTDLVSGIVSLRMASKYLVNANIGKDEKLTENRLAEFELLLSGILSEIFNPKIPFIQTENTETCRNCAYQTICNRVIN